MRPLRIIVASPDEAVVARTASVLANRGHRVVKRSSASIDAMEACFEGTVDLAVMDEDLQGISGSRIAEVLLDLRSPVAAVVLDRGNAVDTHGPVLTIDPDSDRFEAALLNLVDSVTRAT
jgi:two-component SAPR family response regulator